MKLSEIAWDKSEKMVHAIKEHSFNKELALGTLAIDKFAYYIEQDSLYLQSFTKSLAFITARAPIKFTKDFLFFAEEAIVTEQEMVHNFFSQAFDLKKTNQLTPATIGYTSYLLHICCSAPIEVAIASILPCFWVYKEVGSSIAKNVDSSNRYFRWIQTYSEEKFIKSVERAIDIFDEVAETASDDIREQMIDAFYKSTVFEWHFFNDSFNNIAFDNFLTT